MFIKCLLIGATRYFKIETLTPNAGEHIQQLRLWGTQTGSAAFRKKLTPSHKVKHPCPSTSSHRYLPNRNENMST